MFGYREKNFPPCSRSHAIWARGLRRRESYISVCFTLAVLGSRARCSRLRSSLAHTFLFYVSSGVTRRLVVVELIGNTSHLGRTSGVTGEGCRNDHVRERIQSLRLVSLVNGYCDVVILPRIVRPLGIGFKVTETGRTVR
jgi:hypothetical protein